MGGKTDPRIITDLLLAAGFELKLIQAKLPTVYDVLTARARETFADKGITPCPGIPELLAALRERSDVILGLVTGNIVSTAPLKLKAGGLDRSSSGWAPMAPTIWTAIGCRRSP
ncbi:MAG: hypothetical protein M5U34_16470 [Chloroflexi bacterium]|nr:hypothetical protein [Chloroflexota bacterium]